MSLNLVIPEWLIITIVWEKIQTTEFHLSSIKSVYSWVDSGKCEFCKCSLAHSPNQVEKLTDSCPISLF